jgi:hypothetical protein
MRFVALMQQLTSVEVSPLVRVIGVGERVEASTGHVELLSIELRGEGGLGNYTVSLTSTLAFPFMGAPELELSDDLGVVPGVIETPEVTRSSVGAWMNCRRRTAPSRTVDSCGTHTRRVPAS